jgi:uracil phosphoribosyltransferase
MNNTMIKYSKMEEFKLNKLVRKALNEQYEQDRLYPKEYIVKVLRSGPKELKHIIKKLPSIPCSNAKGEETICTKIPEVVQVYLTGRY